MGVLDTMAEICDNLTYHDECLVQTKDNKILGPIIDNDTKKKVNNFYKCNSYDDQFDFTIPLAYGIPFT